MSNLIDNNQQQQEENPYLLLGFVEFGIIATLMVVFFPWSLLFCLLTIGMEGTKLLIIALLHDAIKTLFAILTILAAIAAIIYFLFYAN